MTIFESKNWKMLFASSKTLLIAVWKIARMDWKIARMEARMLRKILKMEEMKDSRPEVKEAIFACLSFDIRSLVVAVVDGRVQFRET